MIIREYINDMVRVSNVEPVFEESYDLVVIGLGTAGAISLITAAKEGVSVLGIEQLYGMGGTGTIGSICGYYAGAQGGYYEDIDKKANELDETFFAKGDWRKNWRETKLMVLEREARAYGAQIRYHSIVTGVYMEENRVVGLRLFSQGVHINVQAYKFIDATGEAVVCHLAGCESSIGREFDHQCQPFSFTNVIMDSNGFVKSDYKDSGEVDQFNVRDVSKALVEANNSSKFLLEDYSEESLKYITMSALIGFREGRLIKGRRILRLEDVVGMKQKESHPLFYTYSNVDNHGKNIVFEDEILCDWFVAAGLWGVMLAVPIPLEVLIPDNIENIMVAGRCLSVDHNLAAGVRMEIDMQKSGEAAAYVCCEAIKHNVQLHEVNYTDIVDKLSSSKCLNPVYNIGFRERTLEGFWGNSLPDLKTPAEITEWLASEKPGWGIWWAKVLGEGDSAIIEMLKGNLKSKNENLVRNSALALGILGKACAAGKLREMVKEPDNYIPKSSLKYVYTRGVSAIYLLGKLQDVDSIDLLFDIVERGGKTTLHEFTYGELYCKDSDVFSQYAAFAVRALVSICRRDMNKYIHVMEKVLNILERPEYRLLSSSKADAESIFDLKTKLVEYVKFYMNDTEPNV